MITDRAIKEKNKLNEMIFLVEKKHQEVDVKRENILAEFLRELEKPFPNENIQILAKCDEMLETTLRYLETTRKRLLHKSKQFSEDN